MVLGRQRICMLHGFSESYFPGFRARRRLPDDRLVREVLASPANDYDLYEIFCVGAQDSASASSSIEKLLTRV